MKKKNVLLCALFVVTLLIDQVSKYVIQTNMQLHDSIELIPGFFNLTYVHNTGAAFSILEGKMIFFYAVSIVALIIIYFYNKTLDKDEFFQKIGVVLIISGIIGNLIDRVLFQYVRDMLDFIIFGYDFAIFNVADSCLVIGVIIVLLCEFKKELGVGYGKKTRDY